MSTPRDDEEDEEDDETDDEDDVGPPPAGYSVIFFYKSEIRSSLFTLLLYHFILFTEPITRPNSKT